jgi:hypothetical protein
LGAVSQGAHFFVSSNTESGSGIAPIGGSDTTYVSRDWAFTVTSGTVYLDDIYWDGGLDDDDVNSNPRPLDTGASASVGDWMQIQ